MASDTDKPSEAMQYVARVRGYVVMLDRSLDTISPDKITSDSDVQMLLNHVADLVRGVNKLTKIIEAQDDVITGLRTRLRNGHGE